MTACMLDCLSHVLFLCTAAEHRHEVEYVNVHKGRCLPLRSPACGVQKEVASSNGDVLLFVDPQHIAAVLSCRNSVQSNAHPMSCGLLSLSFRLSVSTSTSHIVSPNMKSAEHVQHPAVRDTLLRYGSRCRSCRSLKPALCHRCPGG